MSLKSRMLLLAIVPLVLVASAITLISLNQARQLSEQDIRTFEEKLLTSKRNELQNYVSLAMTSIEHLLHQPNPDKSRIKQVLSRLTYGQDSYYFAYTQAGTNLIHPRQPSLEGQNLYDYQDREGNYIIRDLLNVAQQGGFHRYLWSKPSKGDQEVKLSYVVTLPQLGWMMGTGLYIDDIAAEVTAAREKAEENILQTFVTVLVLVTVTIVVLVLAIILINIRTTVQADERIRQLAQRYIQWQISQRHRFARELKEDVAPLLQTCSVGLHATNTHDLASRLASISQPLQQALVRLDEISQQLRPSPLDELGLKEALRQLANEWQQQMNIPISLRIRLPAERLPDEIENTLYRIAEEALSNSAHHAEANQVKLHLWSEDHSICLELEDDGKGFYAEEAGSGLVKMRERTELLSGSFELLSKPGQGTLIRATLPGHSHT